MDLWTQIGKERVGGTERTAVTFIHHHCTIASQVEAAVQHRELSSVLGDDIDGWNERVGGRCKTRGIYEEQGVEASHWATHPEGPEPER